MRICLVLFALLAATTVAVALSADKPIDLTGADASQFRSQVGHTVILGGRLEHAKQGLSLAGGTSDVAFYVIPEIPPSGVYSYPTAWTQFIHQQVRVTGELRFRSFDRSKAGPSVQVPPGYFYMVLQHTKIEHVESK